MRTVVASRSLRLVSALFTTAVLCAPATVAAQRTPATLSTNRVTFRRPMPVNACVATAETVLNEHGWNNVTSNNNQTVMASRPNVVVHIVCTPSVALIAAAGSGVSPSAFIDEVKDAFEAMIGSP